MAKPVLTETGERLYNQLAPTFFKSDEQYGWAGAIFCAAFARMFDDAAEVVQPSGSKPGFAILTDIVNVKAKWLAWVAQFVGVDLTKSPNEATSRAWIKSPLGYTRGQTAAMLLAAQATLTGTKTVYFYTRYGGEAFQIKAATLESETPSQATTKEAIESMMASWDVLKYEAVKGGTIALLEAAHALMSEDESAHATMEDVELHPEK
jgi:hypothetical protein